MATARTTTTTRLGTARAFVTAARTATRPGSASLISRAQAVPRMAGDVFSGRYLGASRFQLVAMVAAVLYLVSPVDLAPEALLGVFGLGDDALLAAWTASSLINLTEDYLNWESRSDTLS